MGGRASEALIFNGEVSTVAADDFQRATEIALQMVTRFGMDDTVGQRIYSAPPQPYLGNSASSIEASETTEHEIDVAVRDIITSSRRLPSCAHGAPTSTKAAASYLPARR